MVTKKNAKPVYGSNRRGIRYKPERSSLALIKLGHQGEKIAALIENESYTGCCLVVLADSRFQFDKTYQIEITKGLELPATVRWIKRLEDVGLQIGFQYVA